MRAESFARPQGHNVKPLIVLGGLARTFGSLVSFLAVLFLFLGSYLLGDAFEHPVDAQAAAVLAAAFCITLAVILFYYLLKPRRPKHRRIAYIRRAG